jgi:putative tryptophan/tyrosine transport system substrate-binding protein
MAPSEALGEAMKRRDFITLLGGAATTLPLAARAQQPGMPVVGFINAASAQNYTRQSAAFLKGLAETGYVNGQNVLIEYRWADDQNDRLPAMAGDLVRRQVAVIAATSTPAALAAKAATTTIPIVFETGGNPVEMGLVVSLSRPGGNVTGVTQLGVEVAPKRLELLHELLPTVRVMALLVDPTDSSTAKTTFSEVAAAAHSFGLQLHVLHASSEGDFEVVFAKLSQLGAGGLVVAGGPFFVSHREQLAAMALRYAVPIAFQHREFTAAGGLLSYGSDITDSYRLTGIYTGRVLKGEKPGDLPVQQATKVELFLNLKTAKALGITVPLPLSGRADELIE